MPETNTNTNTPPAPAEEIKNENVAETEVKEETTENVEEGSEKKKEEKVKNSLLYINREVDTKYKMRAICVVNILYKLIEQAISEGIDEYKIMYAYEEELFTMGYEKKEKYTFAVWCPDNSVRTFDSLDELKKKVTLGHEVTVLREFLTGPEQKIAEVGLEDNFILKPFLVHSNNRDYNRNMSKPIADMMQKLADSKIQKVDKASKSTLIAIVIMIVVLLVFVFFFI